MAARMAGEELIRALEGAGGTLRVPNPSGSVRHACRSAIHDALERHLVPAGHRLRHTGRDKGSASCPKLTPCRGSDLRG